MLSSLETYERPAHDQAIVQNANAPDKPPLSLRSGFGPCCRAIWCHLIPLLQFPQCELSPNRYPNVCITSTHGSTERLEMAEPDRLFVTLPSLKCRQSNSKVR